MASRALGRFCLSGRSSVGFGFFQSRTSWSSSVAMAAAGPGVEPASKPEELSPPPPKPLMKRFEIYRYGEKSQAYSVPAWRWPVQKQLTTAVAS